MDNKTFLYTLILTNKLEMSKFKRKTVNELCSLDFNVSDMLKKYVNDKYLILYMQSILYIVKIVNSQIVAESLVKRLFHLMDTYKRLELSDNITYTVRLNQEIIANCESKDDIEEMLDKYSIIWVKNNEIIDIKIDKVRYQINGGSVNRYFNLKSDNNTIGNVSLVLIKGDKIKVYKDTNIVELYKLVQSKAYDLAIIRGRFENE